MPRVAATHQHWAATSPSAHYHLCGAAAESAGVPAASILISASAILVGVAVAALVTLITLCIRLGIRLAVRLAVRLAGVGGRSSGASKIVGRGTEAKSFRDAEIDSHKPGSLAEVARDNLFAQQRCGIEDAKAGDNRPGIPGSCKRRPVGNLVVEVVITARNDVERSAGTRVDEGRESKPPGRSVLAAKKQIVTDITAGASPFG